MIIVDSTRATPTSFQHILEIESVRLANSRNPFSSARGTICCLPARVPKAAPKSAQTRDAAKTSPHPIRRSRESSSARHQNNPCRISRQAAKPHAVYSQGHPTPWKNISSGMYFSASPETEDHGTKPRSQKHSGALASATAGTRLLIL